MKAGLAVSLDKEVTLKGTAKRDFQVALQNHLCELVEPLMIQLRQEPTLRLPNYHYPEIIHHSNLEYAHRIHDFIRSGAPTLDSLRAKIGDRDSMSFMMKLSCKPFEPVTFKGNGRIDRFKVFSYAYPVTITLRIKQQSGVSLTGFDLDIAVPNSAWVLPGRSVMLLYAQELLSIEANHHCQVIVQTSIWDDGDETGKDMAKLLLRDSAQAGFFPTHDVDINLE